MNVTQTTALKWTFYALATLLLCFFKRVLLGSVTVWGVLPFLPPVLLAVVASFEQPKAAVLSGIVFGALCEQCCRRASRASTRSLSPSPRCSPLR